MIREISEKIKLRYVYMLYVDNRGKKSKYFGHKSILYVGQASDLAKRIEQHKHGVVSYFLKNNFPDAKKKLVYVEYILGTEYDSMSREVNLKNKDREHKLKLINSERNSLINYVPGKCIILRKYMKPDEECAIRL